MKIISFTDTNSLDFTLETIGELAIDFEDSPDINKVDGDEVSRMITLSSKTYAVCVYVPNHINYEFIFDALTKVYLKT